MWLNFTKTIYNYQSVAYYRAVMAFSLKEKKIPVISLVGS